MRKERLGNDQDSAFPKIAGEDRSDSKVLIRTSHTGDMESPAFMSISEVMSGV